MLLYKFSKCQFGLAYLHSRKENVPVRLCEAEVFESFLVEHVARKDGFAEAGAGEDGASSYDPGFVGVALPHVVSLPRLLESEKEQILGKHKGGAKPAAWSRTGVPLFWCDSKPTPQFMPDKLVETFLQEMF